MTLLNDKINKTLESLANPPVFQDKVDKFCESFASLLVEIEKDGGGYCLSRLFAKQFILAAIEFNARHLWEPLLQIPRLLLGMGSGYSEILAAVIEKGARECFDILVYDRAPEQLSMCASFSRITPLGLAILRRNCVFMERLLGAGVDASGDPTKDVDEHIPNLDIAWQVAQRDGIAKYFFQLIKHGAYRSDGFAWRTGFAFFLRDPEITPEIADHIARLLIRRNIRIGRLEGVAQALADRYISNDVKQAVRDLIECESSGAWHTNKRRPVDSEDHQALYDSLQVPKRNPAQNEDDDNNDDSHEQA